MTKRKPTAQKPKPAPATQPLDPAELPDSAPAAVAEATNPLRDTLYRLLDGARPANHDETMLLFKWHHLSKWERYALAFAWELPHPQQEHERLAKQAAEKMR